MKQVITITVQDQVISPSMWRGTAAQWQCRLKIKGFLLQDSPEVPRCVIEHDTLSSAKNWFNPGRQEIVPT